MEMLEGMWAWMKANDLPNWLIFFFTIILWPLVLYVWSQRRVRNIPNLEVSVLDHKGGLKIGEQDYSSIEIRFANNTGSVVYLTNYRVLRCTKNFLVHSDAERDIEDGTVPIKFFDPPTKRFRLRQITLQTGDKASTAIPLQTVPNKELLSHRPSWLRKAFNWQKYFWLEYTAMVGSKRYRVRTIY